MQSLPDNHVQTVITSPPYFSLRDYGIEGQVGVEQDPNEYVAKLVSVFREVRRILRDDGTLWLNLGDSYSGSHKGLMADGVYRDKKNQKLEGMRVVPTPSDLPPKNLLGIPWRVALALQADGWCLRQEIIWHKPNAQPESVLDRLTDDHEHVFLLSKRPWYFFDVFAIKEPVTGSSNRSEFRRKRSVWSVNTKAHSNAHVAVFPTALIEPMVLASTSAHGCCSVCGSPWSHVDGVWNPTCDHDDQTVVPCKVFDPFSGSGTTAVVALNLGRDFIGTELNPEYVRIAEERIQTEVIRPFDFDA